MLMKRIGYKWLSLLFALLLAVGAMASCGSRETGDETGTGGNSDSGVTKTETDTGTGGNSDSGVTEADTGRNNGEWDIVGEGSK